MIFEGEKIRDLTDTQKEKLASLKPLYEDWNSRINVISRKDMDRFYIHHVLHSISIAQVFDFENNSQVMDLGCGGGFPGIPLAICFPEVQFHLVDSIGKKIKVVNEVARALELPNVTTQHGRAEELKGRHFDCIVSRAVAPLKDLLRWSAPLMNKRNKDAYGLICLKGGDLAQEISEAGKRVNVWQIHGMIFNDDWFRDKYILQVH